MGREIQKKKRRSKLQPVRPRTPSHKVLNPRGNTLIAHNWNKNETLAQNYRRLGLVARLQRPTGGIEKALDGSSSRRAGFVDRTSPADSLDIASVDGAVVSEARVERDAAGRITRILRPGTVANPLNDPLCALNDASSSDDDDDYRKPAATDANEADTSVLGSLIRLSRFGAAAKPRRQSAGERAWLRHLVAEHGDDVSAMARDLRRNPMQQTAADIARRLKKMAREEKDAAAVAPVSGE